jgi:hypothetical protein
MNIVVVVLFNFLVELFVVDIMIVVDGGIIVDDVVVEVLVVLVI